MDSIQTLTVDGVEVLLPKTAAKLISNAAKDVSIVQEGVEKTAKKVFEEIQADRLNVKRFKQMKLHPSKTNERCVDWIFVVDTLNFSFWTGKDSMPRKLSTEESNDTALETTEVDPKWQVKYNGEIYTGYFALCAGVNRAIEEGVDLTDPKVYGSLSEKDILHIFRSETSTQIPMVGERVKNLKEVSQVLLEKYKGSFVNCVKACGQNAQRLLRQVVTEFPCFRDHSFFETRTVALWKRAQILVADIWACHEGTGLGDFEDIDSLTLFADYRIPQVLLHYGALKYSPELYKILETNEEIENGSRVEVEIRGSSIHVAELIKDIVREDLAAANLSKDSVNSIIIDHFLWDYRREFEADMDKYPFHKTRCIFY